MSAAVLTPPGVPAAAPAVPPAPTVIVTSPAAVASAPPAEVAAADLWRFSVADYEKLHAAGILTSDDRCELLDGIVVRKMAPNPPHVVVTRLTDDALGELVPEGWCVRNQAPVALDGSRPEPDVAVARGRTRDYLQRHPTATDLALVVEVSDSSIGRDQHWKRAVYARSGIPTYWIVNLDETPAQLEVYTAPVDGEYTQSATLTAADRADVVLDGVTVGSVAVAELLP
jgi:Uma2 family endonuclease